MAVEPTPNKPINQQSKEFNNDEIDLFELWERLYQQKLLIFVIMGLFISAGIIYSFVATPAYKASAYLLPPLSQDVQALQVNLKNPSLNQDLKNINTLKKEVFESFL